MPRHLRLRLPHIPVHVIQRGNNRSYCFWRARDYECYLGYLAAELTTHCVALHAYVLMTNHVHLLMTPTHETSIERLMKTLSQRYARYVNQRSQRSGTLWEGRYRSCLVDAEDYLLTCHRYIENNPVRAGMVTRAGAYRWSSYRCNAEGVPDPLVTRHPLIDEFGDSPEQRRRIYKEFVSRDVGSETLEEIRTATNGGFVLGRETFQERVATSLHRPAAPRRPGRPRTATSKSEPDPDFADFANRSLTPF